MDTENHFVGHYQALGAQVLPGSSLLDPAIPMTYVMSAGLSQVESASAYSAIHAGERYVLMQICFRHFDLDKIGYSPFHLSLFHMGGAFHFGPTPRGITIGSIWRFLTETLAFDIDHLRVTCFTGGTLEGHELDADSETLRAWQTVGLPDAQIYDAGATANLWKQGGGITGEERYRKCGLTTEVFYDRGPAWACRPGCGPGCLCGRFIEIANVLFIRWAYDEITGNLSPLVTPFDETVIGVERITTALEGKSNVFELQDLKVLVDALRPYCKSTASNPGTGVKSEWIIADHIRALLFLVADGAPPPGKGGRAGIIRKMIRTILTHQRLLGIQQSFFLVSLLDATLGYYSQRFPQLVRGRDRLLEYLAAETTRFERALAAGYRYLDRLVACSNDQTLHGEDGVQLVKHRGVPLALLEAELVRRSLRLDYTEFQLAYDHWEQKERETWRKGLSAPAFVQRTTI